MGAAARRQSSGWRTKTPLFPLSLKPIWRRGDLFGLSYLCSPVRNHITKLVYPLCPLDSWGVKSLKSSNFSVHMFPQMCLKALRSHCTPNINALKITPFLPLKYTRQHPTYISKLLRKEQIYVFTCFYLFPVHILRIPKLLIHWNVVSMDILCQLVTDSNSTYCNLITEHGKIVAFFPPLCQSNEKGHKGFSVCVSLGHNFLSMIEYFNSNKSYKWWIEPGLGKEREMVDGRNGIFPF